MLSIKNKKIGLIGIGLMGQPMGFSLMSAGARLVVYNRSPEKIEAIVKEGAIGAISSQAVAELADVVIIMSVDTNTVNEILFGPKGIIFGIKKNSLIIDMGTTDIEQTRKFAKKINSAGGHYIDAPVSGGTIGAENATLTIMAGGCLSDIERARPIFDVLGSRFTHIGPVGSGQVAKIANQMIVGLTIGAVAEAFTLASRSGIDLKKVLGALKGGFADSRILNLHGERMINGNFLPGGKCKTQCKDLNLALSLAEKININLPGTKLNHELYLKAIDAGLGELDHSALYKVINKN